MARGNPGRGVVLVVLAAVFCVLVLGTQAWADKQASVKKGIELYDQGKFKEAVLEFRSALQEDGRYAEAHYRLALTYLKLGDLGQAYRLFFNVVNLDPDNLDAQVRIGQLSLLAGRADEAMERAELVLRQKPQDVEALVLQGQTHAQRGDGARAVETFKQVLTLDPKRADVYVLMGQQHSEEARYDMAEREYRKAMELAPQLLTPRLLMIRMFLGQRQDIKAVEALKEAATIHPNEPKLQMMLVELYQRQHRPEQAESALKELIARFPNDERYRLALARQYGGQGRHDLAEKTYLDAVRMHQESIWPALLLARYYAGRGDQKQAQAYLEQAAKSSPKSPVPQNALVEFDLERGQLDQAETRLKAVLKDHPNDTSSQTLMGRILLARGEVEKSVAAFTNVIRERPDDAEALYRRAQSYVRQQKLQLALADLNKAVKVDVTDNRLRFMLAAIAAQGGDVLQALSQMDQVLLADPHNAAAMEMRGRLYLAQSNFVKAEQDFRALVKREPDAPVGYLRLAMVNQARGKNAEAVEMYEQALAKDPDSLDALSRMAFLLVSMNQGQQAISRVQAQLGKTQRKDLVHSLLGDMYQVAKELDKAREEYKQAVTRNPTLTSGYMGLAAVERAKENIPESLKHLDQALEREPENASALVARGDLRELSGNMDGAEEDYRKALSINDDYVPALNNLAYLLARKGGDKALNEALPLVQRARRLAPAEPRLTDTLGWVLFKRGATASAVTELEEAAKQLPDSPSVQYHLAAVLAALDRVTEAKPVLAKAINSKNLFRERDDAVKLMRQLESRPR